MKKIIFALSVCFMLPLFNAFSAQSSGGDIDVNLVLINTLSGSASGGGVDVNFFLTQLPTGSYSSNSIDANLGAYFNEINQILPSGTSGKTHSENVIGTTLQDLFFGGKNIYNGSSANPNASVLVWVDVNRSIAFGGGYTFVININPNDSAINFVVRESISKLVAADVNQLTFSILPSRVLEEDPVVEWDFNALPKGTKTITYSVSRLADSSIDGNNFEAFFDGLTTTQVIYPFEEAVKPNLCASVVCEDNNSCTIDACDNGLCRHFDKDSPECTPVLQHIEQEENSNDNSPAILILSALFFVFVIGLVIVRFKKKQ